MSKFNRNHAAFPFDRDAIKNREAWDAAGPCNGLTKFELAAMFAMQGLLAAPVSTNNKECSVKALDYANSLCNRLEEKNDKP